MEESTTNCIFNENWELVIDMLQALLVDDSKGSLRTLRNLLKRFCPQVEIVGEAESPDAAYELMLTHNPNLLLLDIEMPLGTGFDLIERARSMKFEVIFITAHEHYALEAIKHEALDYILKPVGHINLMEAIKRAEQRILERSKGVLPPPPETPVKEPKASVNKLPIPTMNGFEFVSLQDLLYMEAEGIYTLLFTRNNKKITTTLRLGELEEKLKEKGFFRIHRSYLINMDLIQKYIKGDGGYVIMENGEQLSVARNRKEEFLKRLKM